MEKVINRLLIFALLATICFGVLTYKFRNDEHGILAQEELLFEVCDYIDIDVSRMTVTIVPYDEPYIKAVYKNDKPLDFEIGDNSISLTESSKLVVSLFTGDESDYMLYVYLPERAYREISVYTGVGGINAGRIDAQTITVGSNSGDILFDDAISRMNISTISGEVTVDFEMVADGTEIHSRRGNVNLSVSSEAQFSVDFETKSGNCDCSLSKFAPIGNYTYNFNGGGRSVAAYVEEGTLSINEKAANA